MIKLKDVHVFIVEDRFSVANSLANLIEGCGALVVGPVGSLSKAVQTAREQPIDVALLDVDLKGDSSAPVAVVLSERKIPFILLTGFAPSSVSSEFPNALVLEKPVEPMSLLEHLSQAVASGVQSSPVPNTDTRPNL